MKRLVAVVVMSLLAVLGLSGTASALTPDEEALLEKCEDEFFDALGQQGVIPVGSSATDFQRFLEQDSARWSKLIKDAGIQAQ